MALQEVEPKYLIFTKQSRKTRLSNTH